MKMRSCVLAVPLLIAWPGLCQSPDILRSADIDALLAKTQNSTDVFAKPNYIISMRAQTEPGSWVTHTDADEIWVVRRGTAKLTVGDVSLGTGVRRNDEPVYDVGPGDAVNIPRTMAYQLAPSARFEYVAVKIFAVARAEAGATGRGKPMARVVPSATIQETFLKNTVNQPLHTLGVTGINYVIYNGAPGPYESHNVVDDVYFVRIGSAAAKVDGHIVNAIDTGGGQPRGMAGIDYREYKITVGDMLLIPRNTLHYMDPGSGKLGYLHLTMRSE